MSEILNPLYWSQNLFDEALFTEIGEYAHNQELHDEAAAGVQADYVVISNREVLFCEAPQLTDEYIAISDEILKRQEELGRSQGAVRFAVHSIRAAQLYPEWHVDWIDDAFSISPDKSTIGISGDVDAEDGEAIDSALNRLRAEGKLSDDGRKLLVPPPRAYVAITNNSPHFSPETTEPRLVIIGNLSPNFMIQVFAKTLQKK